MGEELAAIPNAPPGPRPELRSEDEHNSTPTLEDLGFQGSKGRREAAQYQALAKPSAEQFETIVETVRKTGGMSRPGTCLCAP